MATNVAAWRAFPLLILAVVALGVAACDGGTIREEPNLLIWGPATEFTVEDSNPADPDFALALSVLNFGLTPVNSFQVTCDAIGTALFGAEPLAGSEVSLVKDNVSIPAFDATTVDFSWKWPGLGQTVMWQIDCLVDSAFNITETTEDDNAFLFRFEAFCSGSSPCTQSGGSLPARPAPG